MTKTILTVLAVCTALQASPAYCHFIWLSPLKTDSGGKVSVYFGEDATDNNSDYLGRVSGVVVSKITGTSAPEPLTLNKTETSISTSVNFDEQCLYVTSHDLGVMDRGDMRFRLKYYAKRGLPFRRQLGKPRKHLMTSSWMLCLYRSTTKLKSTCTSIKSLLRESS